MHEQGSGLIINVSSHATGRAKRPGSKTILPYLVVKAALHRLTAATATEWALPRRAAVAGPADLS